MILEDLARIFAEKIPFNKQIGFQFEFDKEGLAVLNFDMKPELVGNYMRGNLHGGVISSSLDVIGGLAAFASQAKKFDPQDKSAETAFSKMGTIDLRVDYLRPGLGDSFHANAYVLRAGRKVAVTRMELHNNHAELIAVGTGAYIIG
ncbi:MAG: hypothetical protein ACI8P9_003786 [Parasphingorhabdus sp.]|jgi:uncharacterized protein (TIGR00369 family)